MHSSVTERSSAWLEHLLWEQDVAGSNPVAPTIFCLENETPNGSRLLANLSSDEVWKALADCAAALLKVANAMGGGGSLPVSQLHQSPHTAPNYSQSIREIINEMLIAKARAERSDRYLRQLRVSLGSFSRGKSNVALTAVTVADLEKWLFNRGWKIHTMKGYLGDVRSLFNFAERRGYVSRDVSKGVELPAAHNFNPPQIHTPEQVLTVLQSAREFGPDVMRHLAIRYFCGVRSAEAHRMTEENILPGYIEVTAEKSKTRRRRLIKIQPVLSAWLALGGVIRPIRPDTVRAAIKRSGVEWPSNVTRHSFVSYHLAKFENAGKTALEAGHSEQMLFAHYRELVTGERAEQFWNLFPPMI